MVARRMDEFENKSKNKEWEEKKKAWNASWPDNTKNKEGILALKKLKSELSMEEQQKICHDFINDEKNMRFWHRISTDQAIYEIYRRNNK